MISTIYRNLLNFILPNTCLACDNVMDTAENFLCKTCMGKLESYGETHPWQAEQIANGTIIDSFSVFWFREGTAIQPLFHALKYQKIKRAGIMLGEEIGKLAVLKKINDIDFVIPVPLHKAKQRDRTYNQSEYIARGINNILKAEVVSDAVIRSRFTPTQTRLNKTERKINVSGAFKVNPEYTDKLRGKNILLADDVITTGATILECASALKAAGAGKLCICSAAYAELKINVV
ncbi:MAG TPA: ComF family protein [Ignavibacteria bacterium]|nr:ComF family protein [Ignavibacteria bacterium]